MAARGSGWRDRALPNPSLPRPSLPSAPAGFVAQHNAQEGSPLDQLAAHLKDPWGTHFITNGAPQSPGSKTCPKK